MGLLTKSLIGKEDLNVQTNANATETFDRVSSTGDTITMKKIPDLWDGLGKISVAGAMQGTNYVIEGDTTIGRVLRLSRLTIEDASVASEIKCTLASLWNGDAIAVTDNIGKGETVSYFTLDATGSILTLESGGLSTTCIAVLSASIARNASNITHLFCDGIASSNDIKLTFRQSTEIGTCDLTDMVDTGQVNIILAYITSA